MHWGLLLAFLEEHIVLPLIRDTTFHGGLPLASQFQSQQTSCMAREYWVLCRDKGGEGGSCRKPSLVGVLVHYSAEARVAS